MVSPEEPPPNIEPQLLSTAFQPPILNMELQVPPAALGAPATTGPQSPLSASQPATSVAEPQLPSATWRPIRRNILSKTPYGLKSYRGEYFPQFYGTSAQTYNTHIRPDESISKFYSKYWLATEPPRIAVSQLIPKSLISHLMRSKVSSKDEDHFHAPAGFDAASCKAGFDDKDFTLSLPNDFRWDDANRGVIVDMEGIAHAFITPVVEVAIHGDYYFDGENHNVSYFPIADVLQEVELPDDVETANANNIAPLAATVGRKCRLARKIIISCAVAMDFETLEAMADVCLVFRENTRVVGEILNHEWKPLDDHTKLHNTGERMLYERSLKRHLRGNLMSNKKYATKGYTDSDIIETMTFPAAYEYLYKFTVEKSYFDPNKLMIDQFFEQPPDMSSRKDESAKRCYSLEILFNTAVHQIRNDISILEACCPQGYVYTHQLSEKYSKALGHTRMPFLDRLMLAALNYFAQTDVFTNMKAFAFYHKYDAKAMEMLTTALKPQRHVKVMRFDDLFPMPTYEYRAPPGCEGALLVLHADCSPFHNFDAHPKGTCAAALAAASSAAASLHRNREDLLSFIM